MWRATHKLAAILKGTVPYGAIGAILTAMCICK